MISQTLPMAAMFMKNKILSWAALFLAIQTYLTEPINKEQNEKEAGSQPPLLRLAFAFISLATCYMEFFFPSSSPGIRSAFTEAAASAASTATSVVSEATKSL